MALIKGQNANNAAHDAVVLDLSDLGHQAEKLKQDARDKADHIVADAEQRAQELVEGADQRGYEQGYPRGYGEGFEQGRQQGHAEALQQSAEQLQQLQQVWLQAIQQWEQDSQALQRQARDGVLELAQRLAEKVIHRQIAIDSTVILDQLTHGLSQVMRPLEVTAYVHPDDRPTVEEAMPSLMQQFGQVQQLHLIEDADMQPGGCYLTYGQGSIDLTLDTQLGRLTAAILPKASAWQSNAPGDDSITPDPSESAPEAPLTSNPAPAPDLSESTSEGPNLTKEEPTDESQLDAPDVDQAAESERDDAYGDPPEKDRLDSRLPTSE